MSEAATAAPGDVETDPRTAARSTYRRSVAEGKPLTGTALGEMFGFTGRWGRRQVEAALKDAQPGHPTVPEQDTDAGPKQNGHPDRSGTPRGNSVGRPDRKGTTEPTDSSGTRHNEGSEATTPAWEEPRVTSVSYSGSSDVPNRTTPDSRLRSTLHTGRTESVQPAEEWNDSLAPEDSTRTDGENLCQERNETTVRNGTRSSNGQVRSVDRNGSERTGPDGLDSVPIHGSGDVPPISCSCSTFTPVGKERNNPELHVSICSVVVVIAVTAVSSYFHQIEVGRLAGEAWRAWLLPLSVDGMMVAASMSLLVSHRRGEKGSPLAWFALILGLSVSLASNVVAADSELVDAVWLSRCVAAWPPFALALSVELLLKQIRPKNHMSWYSRTVEVGA